MQVDIINIIHHVWKRKKKGNVRLKLIKYFFSRIFKLDKG